MRIYWTDEEGEWLALDKGGHFLLHAAIVRVALCLGIHPALAFLISAAWGVLYETVGDCWLVPLFSRVFLHKTYAGGVSWKDLIANTAGGVLGLLL